MALPSVATAPRPPHQPKVKASAPAMHDPKPTQLDKRATKGLKFIPNTSSVSNAQRVSLGDFEPDAGDY